MSTSSLGPFKEIKAKMRMGVLVGGGSQELLAGEETGFHVLKGKSFTATVIMVFLSKLLTTGNIHQGATMGHKIIRLYMY